MVERSQSTQCEGEVTIAERSAESSPVKFYSSWKCPYAQRIWIGLEEKDVAYQWIDIQQLKQEHPPTVANGCDTSPPICTPPFAASSWWGQLPALYNDGEHIWDSVIALEYIHETFSGAPLLPATPLLRAKVRLWTKHVDADIVPHFDRLLFSDDSEARDQARLALSQGLAEFQAAMAPESEGPFFLGDDFSMADIALAPWWQRMCTALRAYRKFDPSGCPRLQAWYEAVEARPSFRLTVVDPERLLEEFASFANPEESKRLSRRGFGPRASRRV